MRIGYYEYNNAEDMLKKEGGLISWFFFGRQLLDHHPRLGLSALWLRQLGWLGWPAWGGVGLRSYGWLGLHG